MLNPTNCFRPSLESLSDRLAPTALPFGGSIVVSTAVHGTQLTESVVYTAPNGQVVTEEGTFAINVRTGAVSGTFSVTSPTGQVLATGTVTADPNSTGGYDGEVTVTGAGGRAFTHDFSIPVS